MEESLERARGASVYHLFCPTCGVRAFSRGKTSKDEPTVAINLRTLARFDPTKLPIDTFDCAAP